MVHLQENGFNVEMTDVPNVLPLKRRAGIPPSLSSCHTAIVGDYVIEGHVPAADIKRLLDARPRVAGLAVAGMPIGSPGMEVPGRGVQPYDVIAFERNGTAEIYSSYGR